MKKRYKMILVMCIFSLCINVFLGLQALYLNRRAVFSENILIDSNYILDEILNIVDKNEYRSHLETYISEHSVDWGNFLTELPSNTDPWKTDIIKVPLIDQTKRYPNGCEAVSATMLLQYLNYNITVDQFIDEYLKKSDMKVSWGMRYGPNPAFAYAGNPRSINDGFGCFSPVIEDALLQVVEEDTVLNVSGYDLEQLEMLFLHSNIPIMIWATVDMQKITKFCQWQSYDRTQSFIYPTVQHALVMVGADNRNYYFNDPMHGDKVIAYERKIVQERYRQMGKQAIVVIPKQKKDLLEEIGVENSR